LVGLTKHLYRPLKRKPRKRRSLINAKSACLEVVHVVVETAVNFLNKLDPMVGLLLEVDLALLDLLPKLVTYRILVRSARPSL
jgi:hypothetical protein